MALLLRLLESLPQSVCVWLTVSALVGGTKEMMQPLSDLPTSHLFGGGGAAGSAEAARDVRARVRPTPLEGERTVLWTGRFRCWPARCGPIAPGRPWLGLGHGGRRPRPSVVAGYREKRERERERNQESARCSARERERTRDASGVESFISVDPWLRLVRASCRCLPSSSPNGWPTSRDRRCRSSLAGRKSGWPSPASRCEHANVVFRAASADAQPHSRRRSTQLKRAIGRRRCGRTS